MRKVTYGGAVSLDGFLAGPNGELDWLHFSPDVHAITAALMAKVDTILMGRRTYEAALAMGGPIATPGMRTLVFSRTLAGIDTPGVELVNADAGAYVRDLKQGPGGEICVMGGGELARSLLAAGVVDEIGFNVHPVLLGAGAPAFRDPGARVGLELLEARTIAGGCVYVMYKVGSAART